MSSTYRALSRWAVMSAIALTLFTSSAISTASETVPAPGLALGVRLTATSTGSGSTAPTSSTEAPFDLSDSSTDKGDRVCVYLPPFDFPGDVDTCGTARDDTPFVL